jgi:hypothetical protein
VPGLFATERIVQVGLIEKIRKAKSLTRVGKVRRHPVVVNGLVQVSKQKREHLFEIERVVLAIEKHQRLEGILRDFGASSFHLAPASLHQKATLFA